MTHTRILGSGQLDESTIKQLMTDGAPIDMFGVGGALTRGLAGAPPPMSYRMAELVRAMAPVPVTGHWSSPWPGRKQVVRFSDHDVLCLEVETEALQAQGGTALLEQWVSHGERTKTAPSVSAMRQWCAESLAALPTVAHQPSNDRRFELRPSNTLRQLAQTQTP